MKKSERLEVSAELAEYLVHQYGSPVYVYDEAILRRRCQEIMNLCDDVHYSPLYSVKANTNTALLRIIRDEGLMADAMSPGEIMLEEAAGFQKEEIVCCSNNMSEEEMRFAHDHTRIIVFDSLHQIEKFGSLYPDEKIGVRLNPGIGDGHNEKVITGGHTKFGISLDQINEILKIAGKNQLKVSYLHCHVGSQFLKPDIFLKAARIMMDTAKMFPDLEEIDFGGGFGIPYQGEERLDLENVGKELKKLVSAYSSALKYHVEPGRYIVGESGELLGTVMDVKENAGTVYAGTDIGFNVLMRHVLYQSHHDIVSYSRSAQKKRYTVTGNICESGDILGEDVLLNEVKENDLIGILDAGAYGFSMSSNYNSRLRPAEVLIGRDQKIQLIRKRDNISDLIKQMQ